MNARLLSWALWLVGVVAVFAAAVRAVEWRIERWVIGKTRVLP